MSPRPLLLASGAFVLAAGIYGAAQWSPRLEWSLRMAKHSVDTLFAPAPAVAKGPPLKESRAQAPSEAFGYRLAPAARPRVGNALPVGKCVNMGGMLEMDVESGSARRPIRDGDFTVIRSAGFNTVRLPVKFSAHAEERPPYRIDPVFMRRVAHVVDAALAADLNLILDMHHYLEVQKDPKGERERFVAMWRQISETFASRSDRLWFELLNEPGYQFWNKMFTWVIFDPAIDEIRKRNPDRPIIVAGNFGSTVQSLATLEIRRPDPNIIPTFHLYDPKPFTHQGAGWTLTRYPVGRRLLESDRAIIDTRVAEVKAYMDRTGRVPFLGEYGAIDLPGSSPAERARYYGLVSAAFASIGVQSCAWSFTNAFSMYRNGRWVPGFPEAISTTTTVSPR